MDDQLCTICISKGELPGTLADFVKSEAKKQTPLLAWAEPEVTAVDLENNTGRREEFKPLIKGIPNWSGDPPLVEARLFWANAALHGVAEKGRCRWVKVEEGDGHGADADHHMLIIKDVQREPFDVSTLRDLRFGPDGGRGSNTLSAFAYRRNGRLIAWRLM
jgi:hypothetical protein